MDVQQLFDNVRFWAQIQGDARRIIYCLPEDCERVAAAVAAHQAGHLIAVRSSPYVPDGKLLLVDEPALEAAQREAVQRWRFRA